MSHPRISSDPAVMMGKPCIKGTRITVELILRKLGAGRTFADLIDAYPQLTEDDLRQITCSIQPPCWSNDGCGSSRTKTSRVVSLSVFARMATTSPWSREFNW
jgi:uncharacterized protein (DUF433 family)